MGTRLTHNTFTNAYNNVTTPSNQQLLDIGRSKGFESWAVIAIIGTTQREGYYNDLYLDYEWACSLINKKLESYDTSFFSSESTMWNTLYGWGGGTDYYSEANIRNAYNNSEVSTRKCVYLAFTSRDRNTTAVSGDYYSSAWYAYYTSNEYPDISVWYRTGEPIIEGGITFTERTESPAGSYNPCYMTNLYGASWNDAWNSCIYGCYPNEGSPPVAGANVLANCTGYAQGRALEIYNECMLYNPSVTHTHPFIPFNANAGEWYDIAVNIGFDVSNTPALGSIICWDKAGDAGHVAVVEKIIDSSTIITTESGWENIAGREWVRNTRYISGGQWTDSDYWHMPSSYYLKGFILNPADPDTPIPPEPPTPPTTKKSKWLYYLKPYRHYNRYKTLL